MHGPMYYSQVVGFKMSTILCYYTMYVSTLGGVLQWKYNLVFGILNVTCMLTGLSASYSCFMHNACCQAYCTLTMHRQLQTCNAQHVLVATSISVTIAFVLLANYIIAMLELHSSFQYICALLVQDGLSPQVLVHFHFSSCRITLKVSTVSSKLIYTTVTTVTVVYSER